MKALRFGQHVKVVRIIDDGVEEARQCVLRFRGKIGRIVGRVEYDGVLVLFRSGAMDLFWPEELARRRR